MASTRAAIAAVLLATIAFATAAEIKVADRKFCNDLECPDYKVVDDLGNGVQLRCYDSSTWAVTDVNDNSYEKATTIGFQRLFKYIIGDNELEQKIDMTAPVVTTIRLDDHDDFKDDYSVSFFLPYRYQRGGSRGDDGKKRREDEVPEPRDDRIRIVDLKRFEAYVLNFGSYAVGFRVKRLAQDLFDFLDRKGCRDYRRDMVFVAVYDPPYKIIDRHNELWVLRKKGRKEDEQEEVASA